jgi:hypothetical protein
VRKNVISDLQQIRNTAFSISNADDDSDKRKEDRQRDTIGGCKTIYDCIPKKIAVA